MQGVCRGAAQRGGRGAKGYCLYDGRPILCEMLLTVDMLMARLGWPRLRNITERKWNESKWGTIHCTTLYTTLHCAAHVCSSRLPGCGLSTVNGDSTHDWQRKQSSMPSKKASQNELRALSALLLLSPLPPHLLHYLHLQLIVATFKATQVESSQRQSRADSLADRQAARQLGR